MSQTKKNDCYQSKYISVYHPFMWEFTIKRVIPGGINVSGQLYNHINEPNFYAIQYMSTYAILWIEGKYLDVCFNSFLARKM